TFDNYPLINVIDDKSTNDKNDFKCNEDISFYIENSVSDSEKLLVLNNLGIPTSGYKFPTTGNRHLKFAWLLQYNCLCFSQIQNGAYCKVCVFFSLNQGVGKGMHQTPGKLISEKFDNWKTSIGSKGVFEIHANNEYHKISLYKYDSFLAVKNKKLNILKFKQGIALRGHKDGELVRCDDDEIYNDGNFRRLLRFRVDAGDQNLQNHLITCSKNAMYTSWLIQNEIIKVCNTIMPQTLMHGINSAKSFTVLADETSDIANKEQLTLCFIEVKDISGKVLAYTILHNLQSIGIETKYLVGQGYDGAASMSGIFNGTQAHIQTKHTMALYIHCSSHCLNLAISFSCKISDIRNCMETMQTVCNFFSYPKRSNVLLGIITKLLPDGKKFKLKKFCPTRWVERHDAVILYYELQPAIISALEDISLWKDTDTSSAANQLLASIHQFKFQTSMMILVKLFSISVSLSKFLQTKNLDLENALSFAEKHTSYIKRYSFKC
ncbi:zinc finger MYM-type protein 1-like, partial [Aphis gossypii]|uniref:zinc finger MYM-type protein 1-like n=1 Tax=Aphis gossypii TaxID=80765 RepID=UPI0021594C95